ncbi:MAG: hypothetical protein V4717_15965 [Bacteroidota bacterium]
MREELKWCLLFDLVERDLLLKKHWQKIIHSLFCVKKTGLKNEENYLGLKVAGF